MASEVIENEAAVTYVLQAQLDDDPKGRWMTMGGFAYPTEDELRRCYDEHFARIEGQGCSYRLAMIEETLKVSVIGP